MKTELVKTDLRLKDVYTNHQAEDSYGRIIGRTTYHYLFESDYLEHDYLLDGKLVVFRKEKIPENMGEFRELNNISSKDLLDWLIKNYK